MIKWALRITVGGIIVSIISPDSIPNAIWALDNSLSLITDGVRAMVDEKIANGFKYWANEGWKHPTEHTLGWTIINIVKSWF